MAFLSATTFANVAAASSTTTATTSSSALAATVAPVVVEACSTIAPFASIFLFTAPWPTIDGLVRNKKKNNNNSKGGGGGTGTDLPLLPYSSMVASAFLWTVYGLVVQNPNIWSANGIGVVLGTFYMTQFIRCLPKPQLSFTSPTLPGSVKQHVGTTVAIMTSIIAILKLLPVVMGGTYKTSMDVAQTVIGPIGIALTVGMFASPLSAIKTVVTTKSADSIPLPFTLASLINCFCWTTAGMFKYKDPNIIIPNGLGLLCSMIQAGLKIVYRGTPPDRGPELLPEGVRGGAAAAAAAAAGGPGLPVTDLPM
eukprot:CAMPEP_0113471572 /NCGR_PEP_ID=MMETSP0014_2-20120614/17046_1 /TAXON_ID=2857 /ORGANISM="Nitzschia sp." /LENGTH=309 /DNA_ID=CAMNT_0000364209 /DNA_START=555 /DNA_END=1484 /DNA_ORIENTATION=- /assembly_acc=CAM_ASM_000159